MGPKWRVGVPLNKVLGYILYAHTLCAPRSPPMPGRIRSGLLTPSNRLWVSFAESFSLALTRPYVTMSPFPEVSELQFSLGGPKGLVIHESPAVCPHRMQDMRKDRTRWQPRHHLTSKDTEPIQTLKSPVL